MLDSSLIIVSGLALGFVISGVVSNVFQLVTNGDSLFHMKVTSDAHRLFIVGLLILAGPHILFRAANRSLRIGDWPATYVFACFGLGAVWSFALGFAALRLFIV